MNLWNVYDPDVTDSDFEIALRKTVKAGEAARFDLAQVERDTVAQTRRRPPVSSSLRGAYSHPTRPRR